MSHSKMIPSQKLLGYFQNYSESSEAYEWLSQEACYRSEAGYVDPGTVFTLKEHETKNFQTDFLALSKKDKQILLMHVTPSVSETIGATRRTLGWLIERYLM